MNKRKSLSKKTRFEVFKRDSFTCQYCGRSAPDVVLQVDHMVAVANGGTNELVNLITSCAPCNAGKGAREISDDSVVSKQKAQLDELNERRIQREMMVEWRNSLVDDFEIELDVATDAINCILVGIKLNENGRRRLSKYLKKYGLHFLLVAIDKSEKYLQFNNDDKTTAESFEFAFEKIGGILYNLKMAVESLREYGWTVLEPNHSPCVESTQPEDNQSSSPSEPGGEVSWLEVINGRTN